MDTLKQFNLAMRYIEDHLDDDLDYGQMARLAGCTEYHFRRVFATLSGLSLSEYVRRRRLSQAALALRQSDVRVIDLAVQYGYTSADAFTRAFFALHGCTPTDARQEGVSMKSIAPMTFQLTIRGGYEMDYRIVEKGAFYIIGVHKRLPLLYEGINPHGAALWDSLSEADFAALEALSDVAPHGILSASVNFDGEREEGSQHDQYFGAASTRAAEGWSVLPVAASTWAVFTVLGPFPQAVQDTWKRIYTEWLLTSGYEVSEGPELLWTDAENENSAAPDYHSEIWIPVSRKQA